MPNKKPIPPSGMPNNPPRRPIGSRQPIRRQIKQPPSRRPIHSSRIPNKRLIRPRQPIRRQIRPLKFPNKRPMSSSLPIRKPTRYNSPIKRFMRPNKPIYIPKKKRKIFSLKLLSISILSLIVIGSIILFVNFENTNAKKGSSIEESILNEVRLNSLLKESVLNTEGIVWWNDADFPSQVKEKINDMTPYFIECVAKICENSDCDLTYGEKEESDISNKEIYSDSVLISHDQTEKNKLFTIFCWGTEEVTDIINYENYEENDGIINYEENDDIINPFCGNDLIDSLEKCDGDNINEKSCEYFGYVSGNLSCKTDCNFNFSECSGCISEKDETTCLRYGKNCGSFSGIDNCGKIRDVNCGTCTDPETCGGGGFANVCGDNSCQPNCDGKCGGPDKCGGTCPNKCIKGSVCESPNYKSCTHGGSFEILGRGLIAVNKGNGVYLGWRLLPWDSSNIGFNVYRSTSPIGPFSKKNSIPITSSTNYYDTGIQSGTTYYYSVKPVSGVGVENSDSNIAKVMTGTSLEYISILVRESSDEAKDIMEISPADLNGDGIMDFILLMGNEDELICENIYPHLEALISNSDGTFSSKWRINTNFGQRCSRDGDAFLTAWDLTGDGKAEILVRLSGDIAVLNGEDGSIITSIPWPTIYHYWYGMVTIGFLEDVDGDNIADPFIIVQSGGYGVGRALLTAYRLEEGSLIEKKRLDFQSITDTPLWGSEEYPDIWALGGHGLIAADINNDGNDEVIPCGSILYPDWDGYFTINDGHCDGCFVGDIDPSNPGPEVFMACERSVKEATLITMKPGESPTRLWTFKTPLEIIHPHHVGFHTGHCGDINEDYPGIECWSLQLDGTASDGIGDTRIFTSNGIEITDSYPLPSRSWAFVPVDWEKGDQTGKELYGGHMYQGFYEQIDCPGNRGRFIIADVVGDSREEYINYCGDTGLLRIFTNLEVKNTRYVTPLADRGYRAGVSRQAIGYVTNRVLSKTNQLRFDIVPY